MKLTIILWIAQVVLNASTTLAQVSTKDGFQLALSSSHLSIPRGEQDSLTISILRSKLFRKGNAELKMVSPDKNGIDIHLDTIEDQPDSYWLRVIVHKDAVPGDYMIIPSCILHNRRKGAVVKVTIH